MLISIDLASKSRHLDLLTVFLDMSIESSERERKKIHMGRTQAMKIKQPFLKKHMWLSLPAAAL